MTPAQAYNALLNTPDYFLKNCFVKIAGSPAASGVMNYNLKYKGDIVPPAGIAAAPQSFKFDITTIMVNPGQIIPTHSVQMVDYATLAVPPGNGPINLTGYTLGAGGPDLMVTGLLNGCTFCMLKMGAQVICAHVRPPAGANAGKDLHTRMMNRARMVGHLGSPLICFGRNDYPGNATVVGVRLNGNWNIFAQLHNGYETFSGATQIL